jgi:hypothetical protein
MEVQAMLEDARHTLKEELRREFRADMELFAQKIAEGVAKAVAKEIYGTETPDDETRRAFQANVYFGSAVRRRIGNGLMIAGGVVIMLVIFNIGRDFLVWLGTILGKQL